MPSPPSVPISNTFAVPSISPLTRFADLSLRSAAINFLVSNSSSIQQHPPSGTSSPMPERVRAPTQAGDEPSSTLLSAWGAVRINRAR